MYTLEEYKLNFLRMFCCFALMIYFLMGLFLHLKEQGLEIYLIEKDNRINPTFFY